LWSTGTGGTNASSIFMQDDGNLVLYVMRWLAGTYAAGSPGPFPSSSCSIGNYLIAGQRINANQCIVSPHGQYFLYMAPDGNFYIYNWANGTAPWGAPTYGHPGAYAILQTDGNLVVYDANNVALWSSGTGGTNAERLDMEDDGRIIIYKSAWNSGTSTGQFNYTTLAHPGCDAGIGTGTTGVLGAGQCFELLLQSGGNLVIYDLGVTPNAARWSTSTAISPVDPAYSMRTLYTYDTLGNLLRVEQHGGSTDSTQWRVRTFTYNSLSQLLTATNPESGTISYTYDTEGNLLQKTSPAPNQTGTATQTVSYCYDELHRVTGKGYGAQSCPLSTPVVTYAYDSGTNAKGHLTQVTDLR
jgi:YD repeat-containing protein